MPSTVYRSKALPALAPEQETEVRGEFTKIQQVLEYAQALLEGLEDRIEVIESEPIDIWSATITLNAGDGSPVGDLNATDFTGHAHAEGTALSIEAGDFVTFVHNDSAYLWAGPVPALVGVGGTYTAVSGDLVGTGTADHQSLSGRDAADSHPQSAITDLASDQASQDSAIGSLDSRVDSIEIEQGVQNADISANTSKNVIQDGRLDGLDSDQIVQDGRLDGLEASDTLQDGRLDAIEALPPMRMYTPYTGSESVLAGSAVVDSGWLMHANADTTERAAPQPIGDASSDLPDTPPFGTASHTGTVWSGATYQFIENVTIEDIQVWVPSIIGQSEHTVGVFNATDPDNPIFLESGTPEYIADAWATTNQSGAFILNGTVLAVILETQENSGDVAITGEWGREVNGSIPLSGEWSRFSNNKELRINKFDNDTVDRSADLASIVAGSTIQFTSTSDANSFIRYSINRSPVEQTLFYEWLDITQTAVGTGGEPPIYSLCEMTATVPTLVQADYSVAPGYWPGNQPEWAFVTGFLRLDGVAQTAAVNAYGVRMFCQPMAVSQDWDFMSRSALYFPPINPAPIVLWDGGAEWDDGVLWR